MDKENPKSCQLNKGMGEIIKAPVKSENENSKSCQLNKGMGEIIKAPVKSENVFILSCHNRVHELLLHLEILKYCPLPHDVIIIHSGEKDIKHDLIKNCHYFKIRSFGYGTGATAAIIRGIQVANKHNYRYACFRNGDDWLLRQECVVNRFNKLTQGFYFGGYNWLSHDTITDFALNEVYINLDAFRKTKINLDAWFQRTIRRRNICEVQLARIVRPLTTQPGRFFRHPGREVINGIYRSFRGYNNRFFNMRWQLIGDHSPSERRHHWNLLRKSVPYAKNLMKEPLFSSWLKNG